jgi:PAS domain S-box-containing protein
MKTLTPERWAAMVDAAPDAMVCVDAEGVIVFANDQVVRLFGYRREELIGQPVEVLVPDVARAGHERLRAGYLANPSPRPMGLGRQLPGRRRDGTTFPAEISLSVLGSGGDMLIMAAVRDITDRLREQAERDRLMSEAQRDRSRMRAQQAERLEALGELAGGIAHDFNNLLAVILNHAAFVTEELDASTGADWADRRDAACRDLEQVKRAGERAARLTRQLLAFARRDVVRPQPLDLNAIVTTVQEMLCRTLGEHIELATSLASGLWPVLADPGQMEQVLVNLAVNARDAMPDGGTLTIDTSNIVVDQDSIAGGSKARPGRHVRLRVSDTGVGMTREVQARIFEPFYTTRGTGSGTGLGLATVYGIVTQAEGQIQVYSEPGTGTSFSITLPVTEQSAVQPITAEPYRRESAGETILVVEDEPALREVTQRIFARNGYQVMTAANGPEAIAIARDHPGEIHLLVTDVIMPQMLGKEVAERIRQIRPDIQVLFMSGYAGPVLTAQGRIEPDVALVGKPFSEADLLSMAGLVLDRRFRALH